MEGGLCWLEVWDGLIDSSFRLLSTPSGQPEGCPNSAGAVFVERWFFPDEPTKQIKKPPYGWLFYLFGGP